jgi:hypothetical protein
MTTLESIWGADVVPGGYGAHEGLVYEPSP